MSFIQDLSVHPVASATHKLAEGGSLKAPAASAPHVIHAVGRLTDAVFRFVGPTTEALAHTGTTQTVVAMADEFNEHLVDLFPAGVELVILPWHRNPLTRWHRWLSAFRTVSARAPGGTVHLHGFVPSAMVVPLIPRRRAKFKFIYSPHGSRSQHGRGWLPKLMQLIARPWAAQVPDSAMVSMAQDARVLNAAGSQKVQLVETPVDEAFAMVQRSLRKMPVILGGTLDEPVLATASAFAQLAVLMGHGEQEMAFQWIGATNPETMAQLQAAEIDIIEAPLADHRAEAMTEAWVFVAPLESQKLAGQVAEAMTAGVPAIAIDCPQHRDLIVDGVNGYLCASEAELAARAMELVTNPDKCVQMGAAARQATLERFSASKFNQSILKAYAQATRPAA